MFYEFSKEDENAKERVQSTPFFNAGELFCKPGSLFIQWIVFSEAGAVFHGSNPYNNGCNISFN